jgi:Double zinc ribbon domain
MAYSWIKGIRGICFPSTCVLCESKGHNDLDLCLACADALPSIINACPRCVRPVASANIALCGACLSSTRRSPSAAMSSSRFHDSPAQVPGPTDVCSIAGSPIGAATAHEIDRVPNLHLARALAYMAYSYRAWSLHAISAGDWACPSIIVACGGSGIQSPRWTCRPRPGARTSGAPLPSRTDSARAAL